MCGQIPAVSAARFIVRQENREQGTINAQLMSWGGMGEYAAAFVIVGKDEDANTPYPRRQCARGGGMPNPDPVARSDPFLSFFTLLFAVLST
jgi:hypothetical protein